MSELLYMLSYEIIELVPDPDKMVKEEQLKVVKKIILFKRDEEEYSKMLNHMNKLINDGYDFEYETVRVERNP